MSYDPGFSPDMEGRCVRLTINGGRQQGGHDLPLALLVLIEEALEAVEHGTAQHERLPLVHHGHQQHHDGWPVRDTQGLMRTRHKIRPRSKKTVASYGGKKLM